MSSYVIPYQINVDMTKQINRLTGKLIYLIDKLIDLWIKRLIDTITFQADLSYKLHLFKYTECIVVNKFKTSLVTSSNSLSDLGNIKMPIMLTSRVSKTSIEWNAIRQCTGICRLLLECQR